MDATRIHVTLFVLLCCLQFGVSYKIYILPEPGAFCFGVFSGDDCLTWSEYSARPTFVDHSTTLIFTPGTYSSSRLSTRYQSSYNYYGSALSVANIKRFTMIGDGAQLQFRLSLFNVEDVRMYNLTFTDRPRIDVRNVQSFVMENCTLSQTSSSTYYYYRRRIPVGVYFYSSNLSRVVESTFIKVILDVQSYSTLLVDTSTFMNYSSGATCIKGDRYSSVTIHGSRFLNNFASTNGVVYTQSPLEIVNCLFDGNSVQSSTGAVVYSVEDVTVADSSFISNSASYYYYLYRGGSAIRGQRNINVNNCTFSFYTQSSSIIYSYPYSSSYHPYGNQEGVYQVNVTNSMFYDSNRGIYSYNDVTIVNSSFYNITALSGEGGAVYSTNTVTISNCTFINSTAINGNGGAIYSGNDIKAIDSTIRECSALNGGAIYSGNDIKAIDSTISECSALNGGAIYSAASNSSANFESNIVLLRSTFSYNSAASGGVLYTKGHYDHYTEFTDCTFIFNEAIGNSTGGGSGAVASIANTSLLITNSTFNYNEAETDGGVLDSNFSSVSIKHSSFSQNSADGNGGVFYGQEYSTNFTVEHTIIDHNSAESGGVFYVRRSNSNIKILGSKFIRNSASYQGGVMDVRGVTLIVDMDTVIANNTAGSSGNVISACVSQITAYGLESRLDPVYPLYCTIYDERSSSYPMSQSISTYASTTIPATEHNNQRHTVGTGPLVTTTSQRDTTTLHTTEEVATTIPSTSQSSFAVTTTSDIVPHTLKVTTNSPSGTTPNLFTTYSERTTESIRQFTTDSITSIRTQSNTDEATTVSEEVTTTEMVSDISNSVTDSSATTASRFAELQAEQDKYDIRESSQQLTMGIISLTVLFIVCIAVCTMMVTLFFMACKKRKAQMTRARYKKLSGTEKYQEETYKDNESQEYSFMEI